MKVYIAGPISLNGSSTPAEIEARIGRFKSAALMIDAEGHEPLDPTTISDQHGLTFDWLFYMRRALALLVQADLVVLLPGWLHSRGACIEARLAQDLGIPVKEWTH